MEGNDLKIDLMTEKLEKFMKMGNYEKDQVSALNF